MAVAGQPFEHDVALDIVAALGQQGPFEERETGIKQFHRFHEGRVVDTGGVAGPQRTDRH